MSFSLESYSYGKNPPRNEDFYGYTQSSFVLSDGATDKTGNMFELDEANGGYKTGGEVASHIVVDTVLSSDAIGRELVDEVSNAFTGYYKQYAPDALTEAKARFEATLLVARIIGNALQITQVGDSNFRVNGSQVFTNNKAIDEVNALHRKTTIEQLAALRTDGMPTPEDIAAGREAILPALKDQYLKCNNPDDMFGYGFINGTHVPSVFIKQYSFSLADLVTVEFVSDGYYGVFPQEVTIDAYEALHAEIEKVDPYKYKLYPSTKVSDDRTVLIARF